MEIRLKDRRHGNTRLSEKRGDMPYWHPKKKEERDKIQNTISNLSDIGMFFEMLIKHI